MHCVNSAPGENNRKFLRSIPSWHITVPYGSGSDAFLGRDIGGSTQLWTSFNKSESELGAIIEQISFITSSHRITFTQNRPKHELSRTWSRTRKLDKESTYSISFKRCITQFTRILNFCGVRKIHIHEKLSTSLFFSLNAQSQTQKSSGNQHWKRYPQKTESNKCVHSFLGTT